MLRSRPRPFTSAASLLFAGLLLAGCAGEGSTSSAGDAPTPPAPTGFGSPTGSGLLPVGDRVCADILPTDAVTGVLPEGTPLGVDHLEPIGHYPVLRCQVSAGGRSFVGSAYLFNMAGPERVQLPGLTSTASAPIGDETNGLYGMAGADDAWLVRTCRVENVADPVPMLVRARTVPDVPGAPTTGDQRQELADLTVTLANGVAEAAGCDEPGGTDAATPRPGTIEPASEPRPITDAPVCGMLDPAALGPEAAGTRRARWSAAASPPGPGAIQGCDLFLDGARVLSFAVVHGWLAPDTEAPGERATLSERLPTAGLPNDADLAGTVLGKVLGMCDGHRVAYQLTRHQGTDAPGQVLGRPVETFFEAFANGAAARGFKCEPIAPTETWRYAK